MFSTRAAPSMKTNRHSTQPSASVNNLTHATRFARGVNHVTSHVFVIVMKLYITTRKKNLCAGVEYILYRRVSNPNSSSIET
jgi:hypothetical protein